MHQLYSHINVLGRRHKILGLLISLTSHQAWTGGEGAILAPTALYYCV